jgi:hypothetical protein
LTICLARGIFFIGDKFMEELLKILNDCSCKENLDKWLMDENNPLVYDACKLFVKCGEEDVKTLLDMFKNQNHIWQHLFIDMVANCTREDCEYKPSNSIKEFILNLKLDNIVCENITGLTKDALIKNVITIISPKPLDANYKNFMFATANNSGKEFYCRFATYKQEYCIQNSGAISMEYCSGADSQYGADDNMAFALCDFFVRSLSRPQQLHYYGDADNYLISYKNRMYVNYGDSHDLYYKPTPTPNKINLQSKRKVAKYVKQLEKGNILAGTTLDCAKDFLHDANEMLTVITYKNSQANYFINSLKILESLIRYNNSQPTPIIEMRAINKYFKLLDRLEELAKEYTKLPSKYGKLSEMRSTKEKEPYLKIEREQKQILSILNSPNFAVLDETTNSKK